MSDRAMTQQLSLITLGVADLAATRAFYVDGLGWTPTLYVPGEVLFLQIGHGMLLSLWSRAEMDAEAGATAPAVGRDGSAPLTLGHLTDSPAEVDAVLAAAAAAGGAVLRSGRRRDWGGYSGYFTDPDGFRWEVAHNPGFVVGPDGSVQIGEVSNGPGETDGG
ncbi:VOC family protein [Rhodococcus sp. NPDC127528]|uniref:VOC family protein n=1 Tax=unclassified Rhodococcus (in: high G+C Gram-positive bacteria) TaxID=192944 RepID=UPI003626519D